MPFAAKPQKGIVRVNDPEENRSDIGVFEVASKRVEDTSSGSNYLHFQNEGSSSQESTFNKSRFEPHCAQSNML